MSNSPQEGMGSSDGLTSSGGGASPEGGQGQGQSTQKKTPQDFIFGKMVGEGSFSSVYLAKCVKSGKEYAIKVCDKMHIIREKKTESMHREKEIMTFLSANRSTSTPFFVHLYATFQDSSRLYFVMTMAYGGELLHQLNKRKQFGKKLSQFYGAEIVQALRHMHKLKICHRDLKPENILLNEDGHILITDFGSGKRLDKIPTFATQDPVKGDPEKPVSRARSNSFVGTAQYVSPEILQGRYADVGPAADLWALGCILYQFLTGHTPFQAGSEFLIFKKILSLDYEFPEDFDPEAKDIISKLLKLQFSERLGAQDTEYYTSIQSHPFFEGIHFDSLYSQRVPLLDEVSPDSAPAVAPLKLISFNIPPEYEPGFNPRVIAERFLRHNDEEEEESLSSSQRQESEGNDPPTTTSNNGNDNESNVNQTADLLISMNIDSQNRCNSECIGSPARRCSKGRINFPLDAQERLTRLQDQAKSNPWHKAVKGNLILKQGIITKRKGLFARKRMLLLTEGPHLFYCDPDNKSVKGEIPWSPSLKPEAKDFKVFQIHTPNRTYYLEDPEGFALAWCEAITSVIHHQSCPV